MKKLIIGVLIILVLFVILLSVSVSVQAGKCSNHGHSKDCLTPTYILIVRTPTPTLRIPPTISYSCPVIATPSPCNPAPQLPTYIPPTPWAR